MEPASLRDSIRLLPHDSAAQPARYGRAADTRHVRRALSERVRLPSCALPRAARPGNQPLTSALLPLTSAFVPLPLLPLTSAFSPLPSYPLTSYCCFLTSSFLPSYLLPCTFPTTCLHPQRLPCDAVAMQMHAVPKYPRSGAPTRMTRHALHSSLPAVPLLPACLMPSAL